MASTFRARTRAALVVGSSLVLTGLAIGPASAVGTVFDDGEERGTPMSPGEAVLIFLGIPLLVAAIVWLLVKAPGWTRSGRTGDVDAWTGEPVEVTSSPAADAAAITAAPAEESTGGTSAQW